MSTPLTALDEFLSALWNQGGDKATNGIEITLPHATALATFAELPLHFGKPPQSITWLSPYGKITIRDADHAS